LAQTALDIQQEILPHAVGKSYKDIFKPKKLGGKID